MKNSKKGFTLIELLAVVIIIGILAAISIPVYTNYMQRARRADAKTALEQVRAAQEMWRAEKGCYAQDNIDCQGGALAGTAVAKLQTTMGAPNTNISPYYDWSLVAGFDNATYTAQAVPKSSQVKDPGGTLFIDQGGNKWSIDKKGVQHNYPADPDSAWAK
jgi:type IV pilus assembly protein PilE